MASLAKLARPRLHGVVRRERLFDRLDEARARGCAVWVAAPPGSGKTALVASWIDDRDLGGAWYQIDPGDVDPATFFYYLSLTVRTPGTRHPLPLFTPEYRDDLPGYTRHFFREYFQHFHQPSVLTLDNCHTASGHTHFDRTLEIAIGEAPEHVTVVAISREPPPACLAGAAASRKLSRIDWDDLQLTHRETVSIVETRHDLGDVDPDTVHRWSAGWCAGLTLALENGRTGGPVWGMEGPIERGAVFDYFSAHIFDALDEAMRTFLTRSALLPRMTPSAAERVTGEPGAGRLLEDLHRRRMFTDLRGVEPRTYQYHDLFRSFLLARLRESVTAAELSRLRSVAGHVLENELLFDDAIGLYGDAGDFTEVGRVVESRAQILIEQGRGETLRAWIDSLPAALIEATPSLMFWHGLSTVAASPPAGRTMLERAFERHAAAGDRAGQILAAAFVLYSYYYELADFKPLGPWIARLEGLLADPTVVLSPTAQLQVDGALVFALSYREPDGARIEVHLTRAERLLAQEEIPPGTRSMAGMLLLHHALTTLQPRRAQRLIDRLDSLLAEGVLSPVHRAFWFIQVGAHRWYEADIVGAGANFEKALALCEQNAIALPTANAYSLFFLAAVAVEHRDIAGAEDRLTRAIRYMRPSRLLDGAFVEWIRGRIAAARGDSNAAAGHYEAWVGLARECGSHHYTRNGLTELARVLVDMGRFDEAAARLAEARRIVTGTAYERYIADILFLEAYLALRRGDGLWKERFAAGIANLRATEDRMPLTGRGSNGVMSLLFAAALAEALEPDYVIATIRRYRTKAPRDAGEHWPWAVSIATLGRFEILVDGVAPGFGRKTPRRPLTLLKAIIAFGGRDVAESRLTDALWSGEQGDDAHRALVVTLSRLRGILGHPENVVQSGGRVSLDPARVWVDVQAFERCVDRGDDIRAVAWYRGHFLAEETDAPWAVATRERLRGQFLAVLLRHAGRREKNGEFDAAMELYRRGIEVDELAEEFYRGLMRCHSRCDDSGAAIGVYRRLERVLSASLGTAPSQATEALKNALLAR